MKRVILVTFNLSTKEYAYFTDDDSIETGDLVVADARGEFKLVEVTQTVGLTQLDIQKATKWIVTKVDTKAHEERVRKENLVQEIRNKLVERQKEVSEYVIFQQMAKTDPGMRNLLDQLRQVDPTLVPELPSDDVAKQVAESENIGDIIQD